MNPEQPTAPGALPMMESHEPPDGGEKQETNETPVVRIDVITSRGGDQSRTATNEDTYQILRTPQQTLVMIADGVGGNRQGALPSIIIRHSLAQFVKKKHAQIISTREALYHCGTALFNAPRTSKEPLGSAVVLAALGNNHEVDIAWCGDSRAFTIRKGNILRAGTTLMHNIAAEETTSSTEYITNMYHNVLTRYLGSNPQTEVGRPDRIRFTGESGDIIILASDGLWDVVTEEEVLGLAKQCTGGELFDQLFMLAYSRNNSAGEFFDLHGGHGVLTPHTVPENGGDNITLAVVTLK